MIIEAQELSKRFARHDAVHGVTLSVPAGAAYALIGANGAGKTTTLKMLVNILRPDSGTARILGVDTRSLTYRDFQRIGFVSESMQLPNRLTVAQYFDCWRSLYPSWDTALEKELRASFDLPHDRMLLELSHGMRVKTMLASALAFRPSVLILDEPLSGLDPLVRDEVLERLLSQADETTILISSHELSDIEGFTTHVGFMSRGRLVFQESTDSIAERFRAVSATLTAVNNPRNALPQTWLAPERSDQFVRFVDTRYCGDGDLGQRLASAFGRVEHFEALPISLRDISKALMRAAKLEANA